MASSTALPTESRSPNSKSPKKRVDETGEDLEKKSVVRKKLFCAPTGRSTRSQAKKLAEPPCVGDHLRESSPEIVEVVQLTHSTGAENKKKSSVRRIQLKLPFTTPVRKAPRKADNHATGAVNVEHSATKVVLQELKTVTEFKDDGVTQKSATKITLSETIVIELSDDDGPSETPELSSLSHHMTTPDAPKGDRPKKIGSRVAQLFPVRKTSRNIEKLKKDKEDEEVKLHQRILSGEEDPRIEIKIFQDKGRGLMAKEPFQKDEFVVEYSGDLLTTLADAKAKEAFYAKHPEKYGCYMYFFAHRGKTLCVDATAETPRYGRLLNHSKKDPNLRTEVVEIKGKPYLILRALRDIPAGTELVYDYGDRTPSNIAAFPWLKN